MAFRNGQFVRVDPKNVGLYGKPGHLPGLTFFEAGQSIALANFGVPAKIAAEARRTGKAIPKAEASAAESEDGAFIGVHVGPGIELGQGVNSEEFDEDPSRFAEVHLIDTNGDTWQVLPQCPIDALVEAVWEDLPAARHAAMGGKPNPYYPDRKQRARLANGEHPDVVFGARSAPTEEDPNAGENMKLLMQGRRLGALGGEPDIGVLSGRPRGSAVAEFQPGGKTPPRGGHRPGGR